MPENNPGQIPEILIRKAEKKDLLEIQKLLSTYFLDMDGLEAGAFLLAEGEGRVLGCAALVPNNYEGLEFLEIHSIAVHPNRKGRGIGKRLVGELVSGLAPGREVYVRTTAPRFFEKTGFEPLPAALKPELWEDCAACKHFENCGQTVLKYRGNA